MLIHPKIGCYAVYEPTEEGWKDYKINFNQINEQLVLTGGDVIIAPEVV